MLTLENSVLATTSDLNAIFSSTLNLNERYNHATRVGRALRIPLGFLGDFKNLFTHDTLNFDTVIRSIL